jgi:hypothetical protein
MLAVGSVPHTIKRLRDRILAPEYMGKRGGIGTSVLGGYLALRLMIVMTVFQFGVLLLAKFLDFLS